MPIATRQATVDPAEDPLDTAPLHLAESARYAVLRRMGSAIRHQIAGALQPVGMLASMLERRAQAPQPNMDTLRKNCSEMSAQARSASAECVALMGWLSPSNEGELVGLAQGVDECVHLLATELSFRGFTLSSTLEDGDVLVVRASLRAVLPACLMALTDSAGSTGDVRLQAKVEGDAVRLSLALLPGRDAQAPSRAKAYRPLSWADAEALAQQEGFQLDVETGGATVSLPMQRAEAASKKQASWG